jgi:hypothetical protein
VRGDVLPTGTQLPAVSAGSQGQISKIEYAGGYEPWPDISGKAMLRSARQKRFHDHRK